MYPFWKGRPGNINLVSVRVFNFVRLERHADVAGRHRLQTRAPRAGVPARPPRWPWASPWTSLQNANNNTHLRSFLWGLNEGNVTKHLEQDLVGCYTLTSSWRPLLGLEKLRGVVAEDWAGAWAGHFLGCVTISPHAYREWGDKAEQEEARTGVRPVPLTLLGFSSLFHTMACSQHLPHRIIAGVPNP